MRLDHVGIHVVDLQRSIAFYRDVFDFQVEAQFALGDEDLVFLAAAEGRVELIFDRSPARATGVVDHLALRVDNLDALLAKLRQRGVPVLDEAPITVAEINARIAFCRGPDGERIELIDRMS